MRAKVSTLLLVLILIVPGCGRKDGTTPGVQLVSSAKARAAAPTVPQPDLAALVAGNNAFAFDLYSAIRGEKGNLFYSPYSISLALAMTYAGARGDTESQMAGTLHYTLPQSALHPAFNALDQALASRGKGAQGKDGQPFRLSIANSIWGQKGFKFLPEFLDVLAENYGAGLRLLDFTASPEPSRATINQWVSDQTAGKIPDLLPQGSIKEYTRLVLANAIYFNAAWSSPFEKADTRDGAFHLLEGGETTVPMMNATHYYTYVKGDGYQAVELPYSGWDTSMVILLPDAGEFAAFEGSLDAATVDAITGGLGSKQVTLTMPRFSFKSDFALSDALKDMGMPLAFSDQADFSGMTGKPDLLIDQVFHKAFVAVDEAGTEAAAATAVTIAPTSAQPAPPIVVTVDRPFFFLIRDLQTGAILFVGRVLNPAS